MGNFRDLMKKYKGTNLGQQEIGAELAEELGLREVGKFVHKIETVYALSPLTVEVKEEGRWITLADGRRVFVGGSETVADRFRPATGERVSEAVSPREGRALTDINNIITAHANRAGAKRVAVENFLSSSETADAVVRDLPYEDVRRAAMTDGMNLRQDAASYKWNAATQGAIRDGLGKIENIGRIRAGRKKT